MAITEAYSSDIQGLNPDSCVVDDIVNPITSTRKQYYAIKGEMLMVQETFSEVLLQDGFTKRIVANKIVDEMLNSGYIEFTKQQEPHTGNIVVRARVFVVPNSDVQILRINGVK